MKINWIVACLLVLGFVSTSAAQQVRPFGGTGLKPSTSGATTPASNPGPAVKPTTAAPPNTASPPNNFGDTQRQPSETGAGPNRYNPGAGFGGGGNVGGNEVTPAARPPATNKYGATEPLERDYGAAEQPTLNNTPRTVTSGGTSSFQPGRGASTTRSFNSTPSATTAENTSTQRNPRIATAAPTSQPLSTADVGSPRAEAVLKQMLQQRAERELPGEPVSLMQVVERVSSREGRIRAVQTYWKLVNNVAAYHAALDEQRLLSQMQAPANDRSLLDAAQDAATAEVHRTELAVVTTQHELAEAARFTDADLQALPSDVPLVSEYRTHYVALYGNGSGPSGLRRLDRAMPYHLKDVRTRAEAVISAQQAMQETSQAISRGQASVATLLEVQRHMHAQQAAFATSVFDYNAMIAEYALHVAPNQSPGTIVGMLIKSKPKVAATPTRQASVERTPATIRTVSSEETALEAPQPNAQTRFADQEEEPRIYGPSTRRPATGFQTQPVEEVIQPEASANFYENGK